jgi:hypothetical protein
MTFTTAIVAVLIILVSYADYWTTQRVLARGSRELNPLVKRMFQRFGWDWAIIKVAAHIAIALFVAALDYPPVTLCGAFFFVIILGVSLRNLNV